MQKSNPPATEGPAPGENPDDNSVAIGGRMRAWRRSMKWSQQELADKMNINKATLRRYEAGLSSPNATHLTFLYAYGVNMNWLLTGDEAMLRETAPADTEPNIVEVRIGDLADALLGLRERSPEKFEMLSLGFIERCKEALHLAMLEAQLSKRDALGDIVRDTGSFMKGAVPGSHDDIISAPFPGSMANED